MNELTNRNKGEIKWRFTNTKRAVSRRELLKLMMPRYQVLPIIEPDLCQGSRDCGLCRDVCHLKAITEEEDRMLIDTLTCNGCGACIAACPHRAIDYPGYSPQQIDDKLAEGLVSGDDANSSIVAFVCHNCSPPDSTAEGSRIVPEGVVGIDIPCLAMVSPWLMLRAFDRGAQGITVIINSDDCPEGIRDDCRVDINFVRDLLGSWGIKEDRIRLLTADDGVSQKLEQFATDIGGMDKTKFMSSIATAVPEAGLLLAELVRDMDGKIADPSKRIITEGMVPFGIISLNAADCTGCGLCALECPTGALEFTRDEDNSRLLSHHELCVACERCRAVCPEGCLVMERILDLDKIGEPAAVLFSDSIVRCRQCGAAIASRAMIDRIRLKLSSVDDSLAAQLELCPECKIGQFSLEKVTLESVVNRPAEE